MSALVQVNGVHKSFTRGSERIDVLKGVNLEIPQGDFVALMGPSGSGKTTLLNLIGGLDTPSGGTVEVGGHQHRRRCRAASSRAGGADNIGFVFQLYNLLPVLTAERNVELPLLLTSLTKAERKKRVAIALNVVGLADRAKHYPRQLSGGQEQRVGIARAIVTDPTLLLADEPTGDLDRKSGDEILDLLVAAEREARQDDRHGHPRPARRRARQAHAAPRQGRAAGGGRMKYLPLLWSSLWRKKVRTIFTLLSIFVAFLLFGLLMTIRTAFSFGVEIAGIDRLVLIHKVSLIMPLPVSYLERLRATEGVALATHQSWFGGVYQDPSNFFAQMAVEPESFMKVYPEFRIPPDQVAAWAADRQGAIVGVDLAKRFNWKVGDRIPIQGTIWQPKSGQTWEFNIVGHVRRRPGHRQDAVLLPLRLPEREPARRRRPGRLVRGQDRRPVAVAGDGQRSSTRCSPTRRPRPRPPRKRASSRASPSRSATSARSWWRFSSPCFFTMLLVAANTMAQSVRERTSEVGVLKTLGFSNGSILAMVLGESVLIALLGGAAGLGLAWLIVQRGDPTNGMLPVFMLPGRDVVVGGVLIVVLGLVAGALPAATAMNLKITDALRRG